MKVFHSLPDPGEMGFLWSAFAAALERIRNVESRRREAERTASELQERIQSENQQDIKRLADAIASGSPDPPSRPRGPHRRTPRTTEARQSPRGSRAEGRR